MGTEAVSELLGISPEAVRERARQGRLVFYRNSAGELRFPRAQFSEDGVLEGLEDVLQAMHVTAPWMRLQLLFDDDVIGALRDGRVGDAVRAAGSYLTRDRAGG